jgi:hypothetical protein
MPNDPVHTLSRMSGSWNAQPNRQYKPTHDFVVKAQHGATPSGKFDAKKILGGKFLQLSFQWQLNGEQHESIGFIGLDSKSGKFVEFWANSDGTVQSLSTDQFEVDDSSIRMTFESKDPASGSAKSSQSIYKMTSDAALNHQIVVLAGGQNTVVKETNFTR